MGVFSSVKAVYPGRSVFNLSYEKKFTCDMGQLIPVLCDEMVPGDTFKVGNQVVIRAQPLIAPIMHEINAYTHYFFVPLRLLWDGWETFISGGFDGNDASVLPRKSFVMDKANKGELADFLGIPLGVTLSGDSRPLAFPWYAYNLIYKEYYADENLIDTDAIDLNANQVLLRAWQKDYFTSALPWQQRGTSPAFPISGTTKAIWDQDVLGALTSVNLGGQVNSFGKSTGTVAVGATGYIYNAGPGQMDTNNLNARMTMAAMNDNVVDLGSAVSFDVADLRLAFQVQKWMERNARSGVRYTEFLHAHFGTSPRDDRLQRPEFLGGTKTPVIISEVLQTGATTTESPQGNLAGHGISADRNFVTTYTAKEFGIIVGIMSIMPRPAYQQGINRQWTRKTRYDYYFPEFANLSEQAVENREIYCTGNVTDDNKIFGYQGRYNEMRYKPNMVCGDMRDTFDYWHCGRKFSSLPLLNRSFIECDPLETKRIFAVQDEPGWIVNFGNIIRAVRPMPIAAEPGLIDHN